MKNMGECLFHLKGFQELQTISAEVSRPRRLLPPPLPSPCAAGSPQRAPSSRPTLDWGASAVEKQTRPGSSLHQTVVNGKPEQGMSDVRGATTCAQAQKGQSSHMVTEELCFRFLHGCLHQQCCAEPQVPSGVGAVVLCSGLRMPVSLLVRGRPITTVAWRQSFHTCQIKAEGTRVTTAGRGCAYTTGDGSNHGCF